MEDVPLTALRPGEKAVVAALPAARSDLVRLLAFGILPGVAVEILQSFPVYVLAVGHTVLAIDKQIASRIIVGRHKARLDNPPPPGYNKSSITGWQGEKMR
jgi:DtxR family Mn-dependent transcriptional regulator/ferrous iron transport protein A